MDIAATKSTSFNLNNFAPQAENTATSFAEDANQLSFELGLWLSGLESFLYIRNHSFTEESRSKAASRDWSKEFRLTHSTLLLCSDLTTRFGKTLNAQYLNDESPESSNKTNTPKVEISADELFKLAQDLRDSALLNEGLLRAAPLRFGEWTAWSNLLAGKFRTNEAYDKFIKQSEKIGEEFLPEVVQQLLESNKLSLGVEADLRFVLPHFAKILKWLSVIERMLNNDEPLQPTLLIFSRIYEQTQEMMNYINNRLQRFSNQEDLLFSALDGAAYTASIELRKVYNHELAGLAEIRPAPSVYAKIETAFSLLSDSFQQTLVSFAKLIEPNIQSAQLFPHFQLKLKQSLILRQNLWEILQSIQKAERNPETFPMPLLHKQLTDFLNTSLRFLFYKDTETVERFIEEVLVTTGKKDLVPILHRFGAYLETLFGQINMRVVLANYPFERTTVGDEG